MDQQTLKNVLEMHRKWLLGEAGGERADLRYANLRSADLSSANLNSADLRYANLRSADLNSADLRYANLRSADLSFANLSFANLSFADLSSANLSFANLSFANLNSADLRFAYLRYADLRCTNLSYAKNQEIKEDFFKRLNWAKDESVGLYNALIRGFIDGSCYEGECACFCGTIAKLRKENYQKLTIELKPDSNSLTECWFLGISKGDTAQNNQVSAVTQEWMREWFAANEIKYPVYKLVSSFDFPELFK